MKTLCLDFQLRFLNFCFLKMDIYKPCIFLLIKLFEHMKIYVEVKK